MKLSSIAKFNMESASYETSMHVECDIPLKYEKLEKAMENTVEWTAKQEEIKNYTVEFLLHVDYNITEDELKSEIHLWIFPIDENDVRMGFEVIDVELSEDEQAMVKAYAMKESHSFVM